MLGETVTECTHPGLAPQKPFAWVVLCQEVLARNTELRSHYQPEEVGKGHKEMPHVLPPLRILFAVLYLDWAMHALPGRTLSQNDWLETVQTLTPSHKTWDWDRVVEQSSWVPLPSLSAWAARSNKVSCFVSMCVSSDSSFPRVRQKPTLRPWKGSPSFTNSSNNTSGNMLACVPPRIWQYSWYW